MEDLVKEINKNMILKEKLLSKYACKSEQGIRVIDEKNIDIRPMFFRDVDRIIHSKVYTRYIDKTQVYSFIENDHITHRVLHVQLVSKIARTIGRALNLNEDLIEAISLAHDVGHTPFGHKGEYFLNNICKKEKIGYFCHNAQGVRVLKDLEKVNLSVQTLDGILAHNGEMLSDKYEPNSRKTKQEFLSELDNVFTVENYSKKIRPMTLEGCVVRISDIIAYIGRDIEDAIIVGSIKRNDLPKEIVEVLGDTNKKIVNTLILDLIKNSFNKSYINFSKEKFNALMNLKKWNFDKIYKSKEASMHEDLLEEFFNELFKKYFDKLKKINYIEKIKVEKNFKYSDKNLFDFMNYQTESYKKNTNLKRIVIDYIAGQTDKFFLKECENYKIGTIIK